MTKYCLIVGKVNVGKTLFILNFAEYLGLKNLEVTFCYPSGRSFNRKYKIEEARKDLVGGEKHKTRCLQSIRIDVPAGKGKKKIDLVDTAGLVNSIHENEEIRRGIAQTLSMIKEADLILHLVDAIEISQKDVLQLLGDVDYQVAQFAQTRGGYAILVNKMDLTGAEQGLLKLQKEFMGHYIIPISGLLKDGFKEVKAFVWGNI